MKPLVEKAVHCREAGSIPRTDGSRPDAVRAQFTRYAKTVVRNAKIDYLRRQAHSKCEFSLQQADDIVDPTCCSESNDPPWPGTLSGDLPLLVSDEKLSSVLAKLSSRERELIFLVFYRDLPVEDVAASLGITKAAAYKAKVRVLAKIRVLLTRSEGTRI